MPISDRPSSGQVDGREVVEVSEEEYNSPEHKHKQVVLNNICHPEDYDMDRSESEDDPKAVTLSEQPINSFSKKQITNTLLNFVTFTPKTPK